MGFPTELEVVSIAEDVTPPELVQFSFSPILIDVNTSAQDVSITMRVTDDLTGINQTGGFCSATFVSPSGSQSRGITMGYSQQISGDALDGTYQDTRSFPQFIEPGTWHVTSVQVRDSIGNPRFYNEADLIAMGFPTELEVVSIAEDITPPELVEFDFTPKTIDVSTGPQDVTFTMLITDDLSGVRENCSATIFSPTGGQIRYALTGSPTSGNDLDGIYEAKATFPQLSETGIWHINRVMVVDRLGNQRDYLEAELVAMGFPTELVVLYIVDTDGDGIPDDEDACPNSDLSETVIIDSWDTGVEDVLLADGCTISDLIAECADEAENHGAFVSAVSHTTNTLKDEGIISGKDKGKIQKGAAKAAIP